ncbi:MAG TPA: UDP-glucose 4-epimerase GalE [Gemmatimonadales bacterium]|jgi:UDP-glucose 4-epimerase|nr:UDP-glucose 4-epimerase GalE [Gemmatimonadales bacterium]
MTAHVVVTGGAGYIGSIVVDQLLARGFRVTVLDDFSTGHRAAVAEGATMVEGSIGDRPVVERLLARDPVDAIVHLAAFALVAESVANPEKYRANNVTAARVLLDTAVAAGVRRFVFSSSCAVYGHPARMPIAEDAPQAPVNPYGETKRAFERLLGEYATRYGLGSVSLRYFNAAGATEQRGEDHDPESHLIPNVLAVALGKRPSVDVFGTDYPTADGTAVRDYIHVADIADAHVRALELRADGAVALNLGTGTGSSVRQVVEAARRVAKHPIPETARSRRPGDPPELVAAAQRAATVLGWRPRHSSLDEIVASAWRWHRAHPRGYRS